MYFPLYLFFGSVSLVLLFLALYDWGATKQRAAGFPSLCSMFLSIVLFSTSWNVTLWSEGVEHQALAGYESFALGMIWFLFAVVGLILTIVIFITVPQINNN